MKVLLALFLALMIWGPPSLRMEPRPLHVALSDPFNLDAAALFQVFAWVGSASVVAVTFLARLANNRPALPGLVTDSPTRWYLIYGALALVSVLYSLAPLYTLFFAAKIIIGIFSVAYVLQHAKGKYPERTALNILFSVSILQASVIAILYFVHPDLVGRPHYAGDYYRLEGGIFADYGNSFLVSGLFFLTVAFFGMQRSRRTAGWLAYLVSLFFMSLALTRSTNVAAFFMLFAIVMLQRKLDKKIVLSSLGVLAVLSVVALGFGDVAVRFLSRNWEGLATLSGRTMAFSYLTGEWLESPLLGFGYAAGSRVLLLSFRDVTGLGIGKGHDVLSTVLADLGLAGALILFLALVSAWREVIVLWRRTQNDPRLCPVSLQLIALMMWLSLRCIVSPCIAHVSMLFIVVTITARYINRRYDADDFRRSLRRDFILERGQ